jgi:hypothetical protein
MTGSVTHEMIKAAMIKAIEIGLVPRHPYLDGYVKSWESLALVIQAALEATPSN